MNMRFACLVIPLVSWSAALAARIAPPIRAQTTPMPAAIQAGQAVDIVLDRYWRGNVKVDQDGLHDNKKTFPHVPHLIEYRFELPVGGEYELQGRYVAETDAPTYLTIDGKLQGMRFEEAGDHRSKWVSLAKTPLTPGKHWIRFTSQYVETPFPTLTGLRLVFHGGPGPEPEPEPPIVGPRPSLPDDWSKTISRKIHSDFHTAGFIRGIGSRFDGTTFGKTLRDNGVNAICIFAKGHHGYAYYDTKVGTRHPGLDFDLMKAQIEACRRYGIAVWTYFSIAPDELYTSTCDQTITDPNDRPTDMEVDVESPYVADYLWPMIAECVRNYDLDGLFFDFPGNEEFVRETVRLVKRIKPGMVVAYNHQWAKSRDELGELDVLELESWRHKQPLYHWQYYARYARGAVPLTAMTIRFHKSWGDFGGITSEAMLRVHAATAMANGCLLTIGDHLHPSGQLDPAVYERIGRVLRDVMRIEPYVTGSESLPYVALMRPKEIALMGADNPCHALLDSGIHFTVIDPSQDLKPFTAVLIPEAKMADDALTARLKEYVENGGRLLAFGKPPARMAELLGIEAQPANEAAYIRIDPRILPTPPATVLYTYLEVAPARPLEDTTTLAPLVWAMNHGTIHTSRRQSPPSDEPSGLAAITSRKLAKGQAVYCAALLPEVYARWGYSAVREIVADLLRYMIPPDKRLADVEAPVHLEVSLNRQGNRVIVHLVHSPQSRASLGTFNKDDLVNQDPVIDEMPTVAGTRLRLAESLVGNRSIKLLPAGTEIRPDSRANGVVTIRVPDFQISSVLLIE
ncbi:MAG TPA: beta-galactosidase trimerization domain-containing protein [Phycisphaerae bacterium]|nr:beta-galactosidase trimerization domain-containing protein [Phycisphaerae bacterium]HRR86743.1 beta-galactosidase trimerization domain-containing protein [Phycisphaerae bacterium]